MTALRALPAPLPDFPAILTDARREIATAKLCEFQFQCKRFGRYVRDGLIAPADIAEALYDVAIANGLVRIHGDDTIQKCLSDGLGSEAS